MTDNIARSGLCSYVKNDDVHMYIYMYVIDTTALGAKCNVPIYVYA